MADWTKYLPAAFELIELGLNIANRARAGEMTDDILAAEIDRVKAKVASAEDRWAAEPGPGEA